MNRCERRDDPTTTLLRNAFTQRINDGASIDVCIEFRIRSLARFLTRTTAFEDQFDIDSLIDVENNRSNRGNNNNLSAENDDENDERALVRVRLHWFLARFQFPLFVSLKNLGGVVVDDVQTNKNDSHNLRIAMNAGADDDLVTAINHLHVNLLSKKKKQQSCDE